MGDFLGYPLLSDPDAADVLSVVDVSDTTDSPQGSQKRVTLGGLPFPAAPVQSVNGQAGAVVLSAADVGADPAGAAAAAQVPLIPPSTRPVPWRAASWSQQFQAGHGWSSGGAGLASSNLNDTSVFCRGTQSATLTTNGAGGQSNLYKLAGTVPDLTGKAVRLILRVDDSTHLRNGAVNLYVGTDGLGQTFKWRLNLADNTSMLVTSGDWVTLTAQWCNVDSAAGTAFTLSGGKPSATSGFTDMQVQVLDDGSGPVTVHVQAVEVIPDTAATYPKGVVSLAFDDSYDSVYSLARPVMDAAGVAGTTYTIAQNLGTSGYMTVDNLHVLQDQCGWEVAGHAYAQAAHAATYPALTAAEVDGDARSMRAWLVSNGFQGDSFAYPSGNYEKTTDGVEVDSIVRRYFASGRTILSAILAGTNYGNADMWPPPMPWRLRAVQPVTADITGSANVTNLLAAGSTLDRVAASGGWLHLVFHQITTAAAVNTLQCQQSDLKALIAGAQARGMQVLPAGSVMRAA